MGAIIAVRAVAWVVAALLFPFYLGWSDSPWFVTGIFAALAGLSFWLSDFMLLPDLRRGGPGAFLYVWALHVLKVAPAVAAAFVLGRIVH